MKARISLVLAAVVLTVGAVQAKPLSRIIAEMGLSPQDFEVLSAASTALLTSGAPAVGQERAWTNDATGSKGTVRIAAVQGNCVSLQHSVEPGGDEQNRQIRTRRCKDASGNWLLTP